VLEALDSLVKFALELLHFVFFLEELFDAITVHAVSLCLSDLLLYNRNLANKCDLELCKVQTLVVATFDLVETLLEHKFADFNPVGLKVRGSIQLLFDPRDVLLVDAKLLVLLLQSLEFLFFDEAIGDEVQLEVFRLAAVF